MTTPGYNFNIQVSSSEGGSYSEVKSKTGSFTRTRALTDVTTTHDITASSKFVKRLANLLDHALSSEALWSSSDTAQGVIETAWENGTDLWVKILPDGTSGNGFRAPFLIESLDIPLGLEDAIPMSISLQGNGPIVVDNS